MERILVINLHRIFFVVSVLIATTYPQNAPFFIAVNDLQSQDADSATAGILSDRLRDELINTKVFLVMTRADMAYLLKYEGFQKSGPCTEDTCLAKMGQLLGVGEMLAGSVTKIDQLYSISVRMIIVSTREVLFTASEDCECSEETVIAQSMGNLAKSIANKRRIKFLEQAIQSTKEDTLKPIPKMAEAVQSPRDSGGLEVKSIPDKSLLFLDHNFAGRTTFSNEHLPSGYYTLTVKHDTFKDTTFEFFLVPGVSNVVTVSLLHSDEFIKTEYANKARALWITRSILAAAAAGMLGGGIHFNSEYDKLYNSYSEILTVGNHVDAWKAADLRKVYRNLSYTASGIFAGAAVITFFF